MKKDKEKKRSLKQEVSTNKRSRGFKSRRNIPGILGFGVRIVFQLDGTGAIGIGQVFPSLPVEYRLYVQRSQKTPPEPRAGFAFLPTARTSRSRFSSNKARGKAGAVDTTEIHV